MSFRPKKAVDLMRVQNKETFKRILLWSGKGDLRKYVLTIPLKTSLALKWPVRRFKLKADGCSVGFYGLIESILARKIIMNASAIPIVTLKEHSAIT